MRGMVVLSGMVSIHRLIVLKPEPIEMMEGLSIQELLGRTCVEPASNG